MERLEACEADHHNPTTIMFHLRPSHPRLAYLRDSPKTYKGDTYRLVDVSDIASLVRSSCSTHNVLVYGQLLNQTLYPAGVNTLTRDTLARDLKRMRESLDLTDAARVDAYNQKIDEFHLAQQEVPSEYDLVRQANLGFVDQFNRALATLRDRLYTHTTVILLSFDDTLYLKKNEYLYKVVTVFPWGTPSCRVMDRTLDAGDHMCRVVGLTPPTLATDILEETWWYRWYFRVPMCLRGRLTQSSGTCWMNAILNCLLLTDALRPHLFSLVTGWQTEPVPFAEFRHPRHTLKTLLLSTISHILVRRRKAQSTDGDVVGAIASRVKGLYRHDDERYFESSGRGLSYGEGGDSGLGVQIVLEQLNLTHKVRARRVRGALTPVADACGIGLVIVDRNHAVCGIRCGDRSFVYDSNNIVTEDSWHLGSVINYMSETRVHTVHMTFVLSCV